MFVLLLAIALFAGCSSIADGDEIEVSSSNSIAPINKKSSSSKAVPSSSATADTTSDVNKLFNFVKVPAAELSRGATRLTVDAFEITDTEITQWQFMALMGYLPKTEKLQDSIAVSNTSWFEAALFCNALSKAFGMDTAYTYQSVQNQTLIDVSINYEVSAIRLPTETEWELAARAGTTTTYYWDTDIASNYAYYAQTSGPIQVATLKPNHFEIYDICGNVAEWVNDWYDSYSTQSVANPTGPKSGTYRVIRGGGWSDKVKSLALNARDKKEPSYQSPTLGFRVVRK